MEKTVQRAIRDEIAGWWLPPPISEEVDYLPLEKTLQKVVKDLQILSSETEQLQTQWDSQRATSVARMLKTSAALLDMLVEKSIPSRNRHQPAS